MMRYLYIFLLFNLMTTLYANDNSNHIQVINSGKSVEDKSNFTPAASKQALKTTDTKNEKSISMVAQLISERHIRVVFNVDSMIYSLDPERYRLFNIKGLEIPIHKVFYICQGEIHLYPDQDLDIRRVYYLQEKDHKLKALISYDGWMMHLYSDKKLGAFYRPATNRTIFRLFAPRATMIQLYLYERPNGNYHATYKLEKDINGVWEIALKGNLEGSYYDYTIHGFEEPGNDFFETNPIHISDPYGQVSVDSFGPSRVWAPVKSPRPVAGGRPAMEDVIAYEVHVQDFTKNLPVDENMKGTFVAFFERGLTNSNGEKIGFDHLLELGINVVHLMPVQEFLHYPDKDWRAAFANDPYMKEQGIHLENYQWGYRTTHALAIESRFRQKGTDWGSQNQQFRDLIEAFHDAGISVIVDMVFNHTGERMDGRMDYFNFSVIDRPYYYRTDRQYRYVGAYGTETKSEQRAMVQRWIIDQCKNLVEQYGVDGFRIDLAGLTDKQTLIELKRLLPEDIIIYGEPWIDSSDPNYERNPDWNWYKRDAPITFFQDNARDAFKGSPFLLEEKMRDRGYAGGNGKREKAKKALCAGFTEDRTPVAGINYLDIHDNWALADRFAKINWDGRQGVDENRVKIAATLLLTSLGPIVLHGGTEFLRSKGHAGAKETKRKFQGGQLYFHGKWDTYNLAKANEFIWENKGRTTSDEQAKIKCDYHGMYHYWKNLIALRNSPTGKVLRIADKPADGYYQWFEPPNSRLLGYMVAEKILVLINSDIQDGKFNDVLLPDGTSWQLVGTIDEINLEQGIQDYDLSSLKGGSRLSIELPAESLFIYIKR